MAFILGASEPFARAAILWKRLDEMQRPASLYVDVPALRPGSVGAYALAFASVGVATALRLAIDPYVVGVQYITFFPAVIITTLISGFRAGLLCVGLSAAAASFLVLPPRWSFYVEHPGEVLALLLFILVTLSNVILVAGMRLAIEGYQQLSRMLEYRVEQRGVELAEVQRRLEHEATFRAMFNVSSVGKIEVEPGTARFLRVNAAMCKLVGYTKDELLARTVVDITHPDDREDSRELAQRLDAGEADVFDVEKRYVRKDGTAVWARTTVNVIRDEFGWPLRHTAVIQDLSARKQAEQALVASKDRLQFALDAALLGWWQYDPTRRVVSGDTRFKEVFDVTADETPIEEIMKRVHPEHVEIGWAALEAALDPVDPKRSATEFPLRRRDGEVRWVEVYGLANFEGAAHERRAVSMVGTAQDVTERKGREEERKERAEREHLLMREINHRAKNLLSVVDAIAHQTAAQNPEDFVERFSERIRALSANQDLLVRNEWRGVDVQDLARAQLAHFADLIGSRIAVHGPELRLKAAGAQAIGLALHELATNAGKYGALSTNAGLVDIGWGIDDGTFIINWTERNGPPVSAPKQRGFGTVVMETMAARTVDGTVNLDYAPSGLTWRLTCGAADALEPWETGGRGLGGWSVDQHSD
jgi:PAS domain S-box-containing protein